MTETSSWWVWLHPAQLWDLNSISIFVWEYAFELFWKQYLITISVMKKGRESEHITESGIAEAAKFTDQK